MNKKEYTKPIIVELSSTMTDGKMAGKATAGVEGGSPSVKTSVS